MSMLPNVQVDVRTLHRCILEKVMLIYSREQFTLCESLTVHLHEQAQAQEHDLEGAKTVHKMLHTAKAPVDGGLALRENEDDLDFGDEDDEGDEGADVEDMDVANEEGEVEEI